MMQISCELLLPTRLSVASEQLGLLLVSGLAVASEQLGLIIKS